MATWSTKSEFINQNSVLMQRRINNQYSVFLDNKPSFCTYYHINTKESTVDKGLQTISTLATSAGSATRYNKIKDFPIYLSSQMETALNDEDYGLDSNIDSECIILPHTLHPLPDDYFVLDGLEKKLIFRIIHVDYDTVKSNSFFKCQFELRSAIESDLYNIEALVVQNYSCVFDNIGTSDKCLILDAEYEVLEKIRTIQYRLKDEYLTKFRDKQYNALMFMRHSSMYLYDAPLNVFCNKNSVFDLDNHTTADCHLLYEFKRTFFDVDYENSIYDRIENQDSSDLKEIHRYYDAEPVNGISSIFKYNNDERVKSVIGSTDEIGVFGYKLQPYIGSNLISALEIGNDDCINDNIEQFVFNYMNNDLAHLKNGLDKVDIRRIKYNLHNYIFIPILLFILKKLYKDIITNNEVMDEAMLLDEHMKMCDGK